MLQIGAPAARETRAQTSSDELWISGSSLQTKEERLPLLNLKDRISIYADMDAVELIWHLQGAGNTLRTASAAADSHLNLNFNGFCHFRIEIETIHTTNMTSQLQLATHQWKSLIQEVVETATSYHNH